MKVKDLISKLQAMNPEQLCVVDLHSEYAALEGVKLVEVYENGGYYSAPYIREHKLRAFGAVYLSSRGE